MNNAVMFSSKTDLWATPQDFFDTLNEEFHFTVDVCADESNHKCDIWYGVLCDGVSIPWDDGVYWCNPPYGRKETGRWVKKAHDDHFKYGKTIVMLLPARTDTRWFHDYIYGKAEIRFVKGRLKFGGQENAAPFPSMVAVFYGE